MSTIDYYFAVQVLETTVHFLFFSFNFLNNVAAFFSDTQEVDVVVVVDKLNKKKIH